MTHVDQNTVASALFTLIALLVGADLLSDAGAGAGLFHLSAEGAGTLVAIAGAVWSFRRFLTEQGTAREWRARAEELLASAGTSVDAQLAKWDLTPAEAEVALLLLKGLSFKEIGAVRDTSERTARDQARSVYKKAGVAGRAEFSAWFIEDLLGGP
ncbi:MAG: helix-turn-helix transcriptional regulator [Myxococcota bacterium]